MKQVCALCGETKDFPTEKEICDECFEDWKQARAILFGVRHGRAAIKKYRKYDCTHHFADGESFEWDYHTRPITDEYGNEGTLDEWTCPECGEVMDTERTS